MAIKILIVDDVEFNLDYQKTVMQSIMKEYQVDIDVDTAVSVAEAFEKIEKRPKYDGMVIDMDLPDGTGTQIAQAARAKDASTRTAVLTVHPDDYSAESALFDLFMKKPINAGVYKQNLAALLQLG